MNKSEEMTYLDLQIPMTPEFHAMWIKKTPEEQQAYIRKAIDILMSKDK